MSEHHTPVQPPEWVMKRIRTRFTLVNGEPRDWGYEIYTVPNSNGYIQYDFSNKTDNNGKRIRWKVPLHNIVWYLAKGEWPTSQLDHKDRNKLRNNIDNLRLSSPRNNGANRNDQSKYGVGVKRVNSGWNDIFQARINIKRKQYNLGCYATPELAQEAYANAKRQIEEGTFT